MTKDSTIDLWVKIFKYAPSEARLHEFARLVAEREREACAEIADKWVEAYAHPSKVIAEQIRSRSETSIRTGT